MLKYFTLKRLRQNFFLALSNLPVSASYRAKIVSLGGVKINGKCFIYKNVVFDRVAPHLITIGNNVTITDQVKILTHYFEPNKPGRHFRLGDVTIEDDVFIGIGTIICNAVTIGKGAVIGAGSIVTKDIPPFQVWGGNPAHYIKDRTH